jgi:hypothetical protein
MILTDTEDMLDFLTGLEIRSTLVLTVDVSVLKPERSVTVLEIVIRNSHSHGSNNWVQGNTIKYEFTWLEYNEKTKVCTLFLAHIKKSEFILENGTQLLREFKLKRLFDEKV